MNFGEKLRAYRKKHHLTQKELASQLNTSQSTIHLYEEGKRKPGTTTVARVARLMHLDAYELAEMVGDIESAMEPVVDYISSGRPDVENAFALMKRHLNEKEQFFIVQIIYELVRSKREASDNIVSDEIVGGCIGKSKE